APRLPGFAGCRSGIELAASWALPSRVSEPVREPEVRGDPVERRALRVERALLGVEVEVADAGVDLEPAVERPGDPRPDRDPEPPAVGEGSALGEVVGVDVADVRRPAE